MGVSTNIYGVYGIRIDWDDDFSEAYDNIYDTCNLEIILDGMSCEYIIIGKILFNSGDIRYGLEHGDEFKEIDPVELANIENSYKTEFIKTFPNFSHLMNAPFKLIIFTHWH